MTSVILYLLLGMLVGAGVALRGQFEYRNDCAAVSCLSLVAWPIIGLWFGMKALTDVGERHRERLQAARAEDARQLAIAEASLNREGMYGDAVRVKQLANDERGYGLYRHELTADGVQ